MKKTRSVTHKLVVSAVVAVFSLIIIVGFNYGLSSQPLEATSACNTPVGVKCPVGTVRTQCAANQTVGADGNCHCSNGQVGGGDCGMSSDDTSDSGECADVDSQISNLQQQYDALEQQYQSEQTELTQSYTSLSTVAKQYLNTAGQVVNVPQAASTTDTTQFAASTNSTTGSNSTSGTSDYGMNIVLSSLVVNRGNYVSASITAENSNTYSFFVNLYSNGQFVATLVSSDTVPSSTRPTTFSRSYLIPANVPAGTYQIAIFDGISQDLLGSASLTVE